MKSKLIILSLVFLIALIIGTSLVNAYYMMGYGYPMMGYGSNYPIYGSSYGEYYGSGYNSPYSRGYYGNPYGHYGPYGSIVRPVGLFRARYYSPYLIDRGFSYLENDRFNDFAFGTQSNVFRFINSQNNIRPNHIYY